MIVLSQREREYLTMLARAPMHWSRRRQLPLDIVPLWNQQLVSYFNDTIAITELGREVAEHVA